MQDQKNHSFVNMKKMESDILINESILRNLTKQNIIITEKINRTKMITDFKEKNFNLNEISTDISNFKRKSISSNNFIRKTETLNNLTLKSNYSEENDNNTMKKKDLKNSIKKAPLTPEHSKPYLPDKSTHKKNETLDNIIDNYTRIKTEGNKINANNNKKNEGKTIKLKSIKTNEKYLNSIQDVGSNVIAKNSGKNQISLNQSSHMLSPMNGSSTNTSNLYKKDNKVKIKIENVVQKSAKKKFGSSTKNTKKVMLKNERSTVDTTNINFQNNYQQFEKFFTESTKDLIKKNKSKNSQTLHASSINNDLFSINNLEYGGCFLNSVKQNCIFKLI